MNYEDYNIYLVEGKAQNDSLKVQLEKLQEQHKERIEWCAKQGGEGAITDISGSNMVGLLAKKGARVAEGWKQSKDKRWSFKHIPYVPDARTKVGRALLKEMRGKKMISFADFAASLGANKSVIKRSEGTIRWFTPQCYQENGHWILLDPKQEKDDVPKKYEGCRLLKLSEFYAIKEG